MYLSVKSKYFIANKDVKSYLFSKNLFPSPTQVRTSFVIQLTNGRSTFLKPDMIMTLVLAIIPVLLLIVLMAFFKMPGDKSSIISLIVTMLIALFGFSFFCGQSVLFLYIWSTESRLPYFNHYPDGYLQLQCITENREDGDYQTAIRLYLYR